MEAGGSPFWLPVGDGVVAAVLHLPPRARLSTSVLLLPPFGWDGVAAYRALRRWADELALEGHPVLRLDWPGTGDSSGTGTETGLLPAWQQAVSTAARWLRAAVGSERVTALGVGLGGLVAASAAEELDDLVLWGTLPTGRRAVRHLQATAGLLSNIGVERDDDGTSWVYGYPLAADLRTGLEALDVAGLDLGRPGRRVLVLDQGADTALVEALRTAGATVDVAPGAGLAELLEHPQRSRLPAPVADAVSTWLGRAAGTGAAVRDLPPLPTETRLPGTPLRERFLELASSRGMLRGIVTEPTEQVGAAAELTVVLLNSGATRRVGPNRMWVDAARRWAADGVRVVRLDLVQIGEGGGHQQSPREDAAYYDGTMLEEVRDALDQLTSQGLPGRFVLAGLCSGAYWSWKIAPTDPRVVAAVLLNPKSLHFLPALHAASKSQDLRKLGSSGTWRKLVTGQLNARHGVDVVRASTVRVTSALEYREARRRERDALAGSLAQIEATGTRVAVVFAPEEDLLRALSATGRLAELSRPPHLTVHLLDGPGNNHTLAPRVLRRQAEAVLDAVVREAREVRPPV